MIETREILRDIRNDAHEHPLLEFSGKGFRFLFLELDATGNRRVNRVVRALPDILSEMIFRSALPNNNLARLHCFAAISFHTEALGNGIAAKGG